MMPKRSVQVVTSKSLLPHLLPLQYSGCTNHLGAAAALFGCLPPAHREWLPLPRDPTARHQQQDKLFLKTLRSICSLTTSRLYSVFEAIALIYLGGERRNN